jgi:hypothetical protein
MKTLIRTAALTLLMSSAIVSAQDQGPFVGNWTGVFVEEAGEVPVTVEFRTATDAAAGVIFVDGSEQYFKDGKLTGDAVEFNSARLRTTDREVPYVWTGNRIGDVMTITVVAQDQEGPVREMTLTRIPR